MNTTEYRVFVPGQVIPEDRLFRYYVAAVTYAMTVPGSVVQRRTIEEVWRNDGPRPEHA